MKRWLADALLATPVWLWRRLPMCLHDLAWTNGSYVPIDRTTGQPWREPMKPQPDDDAAARPNQKWARRERKLRKRRSLDMQVSGKSVFLIQEIIGKKAKEKD